MSWNHRILAHENNGEIYFQLHEVYYTNEVPDGYTANPITVGSETIKGIKWTLNKMQEAIKKRILTLKLYKNDKFRITYRNRSVVEF